LYAFVLSIVVVGLAFAGVPSSMLLIGLLALACPLMMMFMMGGGHGGSDEDADTPGRSDNRGQRPAAGGL
jgi:hypothetical protein